METSKMITSTDFINNIYGQVSYSSNKNFVGMIETKNLVMNWLKENRKRLSSVTAEVKQEKFFYNLYIDGVYVCMIAREIQKAIDYKALEYAENRVFNQAGL